MRNLNYSFLAHPITEDFIDVPVKELPFVVDDFHRLCDLVFAPHPVTKLPCSDLQVLFSNSVPDEIADFVRRNLQSPQQMGVSSIIEGHQVDDDTLLALTRNIGEDDRSYIDRCDGLIREYMSKQEKGS